MGVGSHLGSQGFGHYQNVTNNGRIGNDELVGLANSGGHTPDGAPRVHNSLASGDSGVGFQSAVLEASHHKGYNDITLLLSPM